MNTKNLLKNIGFSILCNERSLAAYLKFLGNSLYIVMYHRFSNVKDPFKLEKNTLEKQLLFFNKHFNIIRLEEYISSCSDNRKRKGIHSNSMAITIDDGYLDTYTIAYPVLKKWNVPASIFLTTDFVDKREWLWADRLEYVLLNTRKKQFQFPLDGEVLDFHVGSFQEWHSTQLRIFHYCRTLEEEDKDRYLDELSRHLDIKIPPETIGDYVPMSWEQIVEMRETGIEFGSHTCSHPILSRLNWKRLRHEIGESKKQIEKRLMSDVKSFCIPNGTPEDYNGEVINIIKESGYLCAVTTIPGYNPGSSPNMFELKRIGVNGKEKKNIIRQLIFPG